MTEETRPLATYTAHVTHDQIPAQVRAEMDDKFRAQLADGLGHESAEKSMPVLRNIAESDDKAKLPPILVAADAAATTRA